MKFICGVLLLISYVASLPIEKTQLPEKNPCTLEALYSVRYFHPYSLDEKKYIKCDQWGQMTVRMCPEGSKWDSLMMDCMFLNRTVDGPVLDLDEIKRNETMTITENKLCTLYGNHSCLNGGVCSHDLKCLCFANTSGDYCEINKPSGGLFGRIINESFSIEEYKKSQQLSLSAMGINDTFDYNMTLFDQSIMDPVTLDKVNKYFAMFSNGSMRFDTLVNLFTEDFLSFIFPDLFFLREFSIPTEMQMGFSNAIPRLLSIAKYSYDRFEQIFAIYEETLVRLSKFLIEKQPSIKAEAKAFYEVYHLLSKKLDKLYNYTETMDVKPMEKGKDMVITREMIVKKLWKDFERTLNQSYELFEMLNVLDDELSWKHQIYNISLTEMEMIIQNFTVSPMVVDRINRLLYKNTEIWDILSFYGFSHVLSELTSIPIFESSVVKSTFSALMSDDKEDEEEGIPETLQLINDDEDNDDDREETTPRRESRQSPTVKPEALESNEKLTTLRQAREAMLTTIKPQALVAESTIRPVRESTTIRPVRESTVRPVREELTTLKRDGKEELTTVKPQSLVAESTTVRPQALVGETTMRPVREELTTLKRDGKEELTTVKPQSLVAESTTVRPVREEKTTLKSIIKS